MTSVRYVIVIGVSQTELNLLPAGSLHEHAQMLGAGRGDERVGVGGPQAESLGGEDHVTVEGLLRRSRFPASPRFGPQLCRQAQMGGSKGFVRER